MSVADLYDEDFYLWTQAQAEALRAEARRKGGSNAIDWEHLAEEVGDLGNSDLRECLSRTGTIIEHLMKLATSSVSQPRTGWIVTVKTQRASLKRALTASLRAKVQGELGDLHEEARDIVRTLLADAEPDVTVGDDLSWSLEQILGECDDPLAS